MNNKDLNQQLLEAFKIEAEERISSMFSNLTNLEKCADAETRGKMLEVVYREAHSLKGAARSVNIIPVETICQEIESLFSKLKDATIDFTPDIFDTLHDCIGIIEKYLAAPDQKRLKLEDSIHELAERLSFFKKSENEIKNLEANVFPKDIHAESQKDSTSEVPCRQETAPGLPPAPEPSEKEPSVQDNCQPRSRQNSFAKSWSADTVRISTAKLDTLLLKTEELITLKQTLNEHLEQIQETSKAIDKWKKLSEKSKAELHEIRRQLNHSRHLDRFFQFIRYKSWSNKRN